MMQGVHRTLASPTHRCAYCPSLRFSRTNSKQAIASARRAHSSPLQPALQFFLFVRTSLLASCSRRCKTFTAVALGVELTARPCDLEIMEGAMKQRYKQSYQGAYATSYEGTEPIRSHANSKKYNAKHVEQTKTILDFGKYVKKYKRKQL